MKFSDKLKNLRVKYNISQERLGQLIGTSRAAISFWEHDNRSPKIEQLMKIAEVFNMNWLDLVDDDRADAFAPVIINSEKSLIDAFRNLNEEGKKTLLTFAQSLVYNPLYGNGEGSIRDAYLYDGAKDQKALEDLTENERVALLDHSPTKE